MVSVFNELQQKYPETDAELFFTSPSPGTVALFLENKYYPNYETYLHKLAAVLKKEYEIINSYGVFLQIDCPDLAMGRHTRFKDLSDDNFLTLIDTNVAAVNRALERLRENHVNGSPGGKVLVKADKKLYALPFAEILFIEGQGDYIRIHTRQHKLMVHDTIKNFMESLPPEEFMRIQKSFVVNLQHIEFIEGNQVTIAQQTLPVSPLNRDELLSRFSSL